MYITIFILLLSHLVQAKKKKKRTKKIELAAFHTLFYYSLLFSLILLMARTNKPYSDKVTWNSFLEWSLLYSHHKSKYLEQLLKQNEIEDWCYENKHKPTKEELKKGLPWDLPYETFGNCNHFRCKRQRLNCLFLSNPELIPGWIELHQNE